MKGVFNFYNKNWEKYYNKTKSIFKLEIIYFMFVTYFFLVSINTTTIILSFPFIYIAGKILRYFMYLYAGIFILTRDYRRLKQIDWTKYKYKTLIILLCFFGSLLINFTFTDNRTLAFSSLMAIVFVNIDEEKLINLYFKCQTILVTIVISLLVIGIIQDYVSLREDVVRRSLGFDYPTNLSQFVLFSTIYFAHLKKYKIKLLEFCIIQTLAVCMFVITDSRTEFLFTEMILLFSILNSNVTSFKYLVKKAINLSPKLFLLFPIVSIVLMVAYGVFENSNNTLVSDVFKKINDALSNRLSQSWLNFQSEGLSLFGSKTMLVGYGAKGDMIFSHIHESNFIDNDYLNLLFTKGIFFFVSLNCLLFDMISKWVKQEKNDLVITSMFILAFGLINPRILSFEYSILLILMLKNAVHKFNR